MTEKTKLKARVKELEAKLNKVMAELEVKDGFKDAKMCREIARDMIDRNSVRAAWIFWDGQMKEYTEHEEEISKFGCTEDEIVKDLHHVLALISKKDKQMWLNLGYGKGKESAEEIIGFILKMLAERGSKIACTGKIDDMRPHHF